MPGNLPKEDVLANIKRLPQGESKVPGSASSTSTVTTFAGTALLRYPRPSVADCSALKNNERYTGTVVPVVLVGLDCFSVCAVCV